MTKIALIQMQCEKAATHKNLELIAAYLKEADSRGVEMIGFPEMCLSGYADPLKYPQAVLDLHGPEVAQLLKITEPCTATVLVGLIEKNPAGKPYITQLVIRQGILLGCYRKVTIKDEEVEWFSPGQDIPVFRLNDLTFGISICADISNELVFAECQRQGARIIFELAAPGLYGEQTERNWQSGYAWWEGECQKYLGGYAQKYGLWIGVATQAGRTMDEDFPGGGYLFDPNGDRRYATTDWLPGAVYLELDFETGQLTIL
jgi:predicted amidohydrolase